MPTAITHFKFPTLPDPNAVDSLINAVPIVVDTLYPIADQNLVSFERKSDFDNLSLFAPLTYKVRDNVNNFESNSALINLKWKGVAVNPASSNVLQVINNLDVINMLSMLPLNDVTEWIEIQSMTGLQGLISRSKKTFIGQRLTILDLYYTDFTALAEGGGDPYFQLGYKVGEANTAQATVYTLDLDIVSLAILQQIPVSTETFLEEFDPGGGPLVTYTVKEQTIDIEVSLGYVFGNAAINVSMACPFFLLNPWNSVTVSYESNDDIEYFVDTPLNITLNLDKEGKAKITIINKAVKVTPDPATGIITFTLNNINGNPALVNNPQIVQVLINL